MKSVVVFLAGALFVSTAIASDPYAEERFKAKYGRYTPAEEARREALKKAAKAQNAAPSSELAICDMPDCCGSTKAMAKTEVSNADTYAEALFRAKFGRPSPMKETRIAEAKREVNERVVAAAPMCDRGCCHRGE